MVPSYVRWVETAYTREMVLLDMHCKYVKGKFGDEEGQEKVVGVCTIVTVSFSNQLSYGMYNFSHVYNLCIQTKQSNWRVNNSGVENNLLASLAHS